MLTFAPSSYTSSAGGVKKRQQVRDIGIQVLYFTLLQCLFKPSCNESSNSSLDPLKQLGTG
jgi:hypothetical protein